jgi:hypothetical protein
VLGGAVARASSGFIDNEVHLKYPIVFVHGSGFRDKKPDFFTSSRQLLQLKCRFSPG